MKEQIQKVLARDPQVTPSWAAGEHEAELWLLLFWSTTESHLLYLNVHFFKNVAVSQWYPTVFGVLSNVQNLLIMLSLKYCPIIK